jgi:hypothetical protein
MAELTIVDLPAGYEDDILLTPVNIGLEAGVIAGDTFRCTGREILIAHNTDSHGQTITITSQPASRTGRLGHITNAIIPADEVRVFQMFPRDGWEVGGVVHVAVSDVDVFLAVLRAPVQAAG